jgi:GDPmannose 4,6-dehydratase
MRAAIIGATGQDGSILSSQLLENGAEILCVNRSDPKNPSNLSSARTIFSDLSDARECNRVFDLFKPDLIFHVAAVHGSSLNQESLISSSSEQMRLTHVEITRNILNWQTINGGRSCVALSSQMYTATDYPNRISEKSATNASNYYGETKLQAWDLIKRARKEHGVFASAAILFNHTSSLSKSQFLFPQLARDISAGISGQKDWLTIKKPFAMIDISSADDVCRGMFASLCNDKVEDFVFGSGNSIMISDILFETFSRFDQSLTLKRSLIDLLTEHVATEEPYLVSDISKARNELNWSPSKSPSDILFQMVLDSPEWREDD